MNKKTLFTTSIYEKLNFINENDMTNLISYIKDNKVNKTNNNFNGDVNSSFSPEPKGLLDNFLDLKNNLNKEIKKCADMIGCDSNLEITNSWYNVQKRNSTLKMHTHANSIISGILYLKVDKNSSRLYFSPDFIMIEIKNITKSFKDKKVLHGISGKFEKGKTNLIIGASGTGKSVLLKCLVGLLSPDKGKVLFDGRNFTESDKKITTQIRREIGMLFQGSALFDSKNVEENIKFPLDILTEISEKEKIEKVNHCLNLVGLDKINQKMPSELSGGMKKRVGIARAIVNDSKYLFCDEPNSGLDPLTAIKIDDLILELTQKLKTTTIVVTHDMNSVIEIGEYIMFLHNGKKLWEGDNKKILKTKIKELNSFIFSNKLMKKIK